VNKNQKWTNKICIFSLSDPKRWSHRNHCVYRWSDCCLMPYEQFPAISCKNKLHLVFGLTRPGGRTYDLTCPLYMDSFLRGWNGLLYSLKSITFFIWGTLKTTKGFITTEKKHKKLITDYVLFLFSLELSLFDYKHIFLYVIFPNQTIIEQLYLCFFIIIILLWSYLIDMIIIWAPW
jgi:hypothetical protein